MDFLDGLVCPSYFLLPWRKVALSAPSRFRKVALSILTFFASAQGGPVDPCPTRLVLGDPVDPNPVINAPVLKGRYGRGGLCLLYVKGDPADPFLLFVRWPCRPLLSLFRCKVTLSTLTQFPAIGGPVDPIPVLGT